MYIKRKEKEISIKKNKVKSGCQLEEMCFSDRYGAGRSKGKK